MILVTACTFKRLYQQTQRAAVKSQKEYQNQQLCHHKPTQGGNPHQKTALWSLYANPHETPISQGTSTPLASCRVFLTPTPEGCVSKWQLEAILMKINPENKVLSFSVVSCTSLDWKQLWNRSLAKKGPSRSRNTLCWRYPSSPHHSCICSFHITGGDYPLPTFIHFPMSIWSSRINLWHINHSVQPVRLYCWHRSREIAIYHVRSTVKLP